MNDEPPTYPTPTASEMPCEGTVRFARKAFEGGHISFQDACAIAGRDIQKPQGKLPAVAYPTPRVNSLCGGTGSWDKVQSLRRGGTSRPRRRAR